MINCYFYTYIRHIPKCIYVRIKYISYRKLYCYYLLSLPILILLLSMMICFLLLLVHGTRPIRSIYSTSSSVYLLRNNGRCWWPVFALRALLWPPGSFSRSEPTEPVFRTGGKKGTYSQPATHIHTKLIGLAEDEDIDSTYRERLLQEQ